MPTSLTYVLPCTRGCSPWRPDAVIGTARGANHASPSDFHGWWLGSRTGRTKRPRSSSRGGSLGPRPFHPAPLPPRPSRAAPKPRELKRKDNSSPIQRPPRLRATLRVAAQYPRPGAGILTCFPFGRRGPRRSPAHVPRLLTGASPPLRTDSPSYNRCSRGTLLHFSLQRSRLNTCYYHQDLHYWPFRPPSPGSLPHLSLSERSHPRPKKLTNTPTPYSCRPRTRRSQGPV